MTNLGDMLGDQREDGLVNPKRSGINGCQDENVGREEKKRMKGDKKIPVDPWFNIKITVSQNRVV